MSTARPQSRPTSPEKRAGRAGTRPAVPTVWRSVSPSTRPLAVQAMRSVAGMQPDLFARAFAQSVLCSYQACAVPSMCTCDMFRPSGMRHRFDSQDSGVCVVCRPMSPISRRGSRASSPALGQMMPRNNAGTAPAHVGSKWEFVKTQPDTSLQDTVEPKRPDPSNNGTMLPASGVPPAHGAAASRWEFVPQRPESARHRASFRSLSVLCKCLLSCFECACLSVYVVLVHGIAWELMNCALLLDSRVYVQRHLVFTRRRCKLHQLPTVVR